MISSSQRLSLPPELSLREENDRYLCEREFSWFVRRFWELVEPEPLDWNWHIEAFCVHAQAQSEGLIQRLMVNAPFRSAKSRPYSIFWQVWDWIRKPKTHWFMLAKTGRLTTEFATSSRRLIQDPLFQKYWGWSLPKCTDAYFPIPLDSGERTDTGLWLSKDRNQVHEFDNNHGGKRLSQSFDSDVIGGGGHRIVGDDPHAPMESLEELESTVNKYRKILRNRLIRRAMATETLIGQRIAPTDVFGWLLANEKPLWEHVMIPSRFDVQRRCFTKIGWVDPRKNQGDLMHPDYTPLEIEQAMRDSLGDQAPGQLDQEPIHPGGLIIKVEGLQETFDYLRAEDCDLIWTTLDAAFEGEESSDYCACYLMARVGAVKFIIAELYGQMDFPTLGDSYFTFTETWHSLLGPALDGNVVEKSANGFALLQTYGKTISKLLPYTPRTAKTKRFHSASPHFKAKQVLFPALNAIFEINGRRYKLRNDWVEPCKAELALVPKAKNDDRADAIAQGLIWCEDPENQRPPEGACEAAEPEVDPFDDFQRPGRMHR